MKKINKNTISTSPLIVVTSYPDAKNSIKELNAVAWHSKRILTTFSKKRKVIVLAEKIKNSKGEEKTKNLTVYRVWEKGNPASLFNILKTVRNYPDVKNILFQFEFNIFGGLFPMIFIPVIMIGLQMMGKNIHVEIHQVVENIETLSNHINIKNKFAQKVFNIGLHGFYRTLGALSSKLFVLENELKSRLSKYANKGKIEVLSIPVDNKVPLEKNQSKRKLGIKKSETMILVFGFINWYKGSDWIVEKISEAKTKNIRLVIAGGDNPTLKDKKYYQKFYRKVIDKAAKSQKITITGFIAEKDIPLYFSAADLVVLPYRVFMSASGPFSWALSYGKPFLLSSYLSNYSNSYDFKVSLSECNLKKQDVFFNLKDDDFINKLSILKAKKSDLTKFSKTLARKRNISKVVSKMDKSIYSKNETKPIMVESLFLVDLKKITKLNINFLK